MYILKKNRPRFYLFVNIILFILASIVFIQMINHIFIKSKKEIEKETISTIVEIYEKENYNPLKNVDFESDEDVNRVLEEIKSKGYVTDKDFFWDKDGMAREILLKSILIFVSWILFNVLFSKIEKRKYLRELDEYVESVVNHDFDKTLDDSGESMIAKINMYFNKLGLSQKRNYFRLKEDSDSMRTSLADISHQIKTPLTSLSMSNEIIMDDDKASDEQREFLEISQSQIARLRWLTDSLLKISKLESNTVKFNIQQVPAIELTVDFEYVLFNQLKSKGLKLIRKGKTEIVLDVDYDWTREAVLNIVKNATEHAKKNTEVEIVFVDNPTYKGIEVYNVGHPIPLKELTKIFDRFYKSQDNTNPESIGIGLNLSKKIIEAQKGTISVSNEIGKIKFSILFLKV